MDVADRTVIEDEGLDTSGSRCEVAAEGSDMRFLSYKVVTIV